jgi:hypothetical protein
MVPGADRGGGRSFARITLIDEGEFDAVIGRGLEGLGHPPDLGPVIGIGGRHMQGEQMAERIERHGILASADAAQLDLSSEFGPITSAPENPA